MLYRRALTLWCSHVADEMAFASAGVYANRSLSEISEANCIIGDVQPPLWADIHAYFSAAKVRPLTWYFPESAPTAAAGSWQPVELTLLRLSNPPLLKPIHAELTIIPARASFRHAWQIAAHLRPAASAQQAADAMMSHLDDPHVEALLALRAGEAVAYASVLSAGDVGLITELFVHREWRHRGYGLAMAGQVLDMCRRSAFKHVLYAVPSADQGALSFAAHIGLVSAATLLQYESTTPPEEYPSA